MSDDGKGKKAEKLPKGKLPPPPTQSPLVKGKVAKDVEGKSKPRSNSKPKVHETGAYSKSTSKGRVIDSGASNERRQTLNTKDNHRASQVSQISQFFSGKKTKRAPSGPSKISSELEVVLTKLQAAKQPKQTTIEQRKKMTQIRNLQWADGHFLLTPNLAVVTGIEYNTLKKDALSNGFHSNLFATALVLAYIDNVLTGIKNEMSNCYDGAKGWMARHEPDDYKRAIAVTDLYYR